MTVRAHRLGKTFFAEIDGVDICRPLNTADRSGILDAFGEHLVLLFRTDGITDEAQIAFSRALGPLEEGVLRAGRNRDKRNPVIAEMSNIDEAGNILPEDAEKLNFQKGNQLWHSDSSFKTVPSGASVLSARVIPEEGGNTEFADLRAAWEALPPARQAELDGRIAVHDLLYSRGLYGFTDFNETEREMWKPVEQALVRTHEATGRKNLYLGAHAKEIVGWEPEAGRRALLELMDFATGPDFTYAHEWRVGDVLMWDNRTVLHRAMPYPDREVVRILKRTTLAGTGPTVVDGRPVNEFARAQAAQ